jgi:hypothetical protein
LKDRLFNYPVGFKEEDCKNLIIRYGGDKSILLQKHIFNKHNVSFASCIPVG